MHHIWSEKFFAPQAYTGTAWRRRWHHAARATAGLVAVVAGVAACGGSPSTPGVATGPAGTTTSGNPSAGDGTKATGLVAYASCMRSHGVGNFPDPTAEGGIPKNAVIQAFRAVSSGQAQTASNECARLLPAGGSLSGQATRAVPTQDQQDYLKAAACMRSHGITNFPDPVFSGGNVDFPIPSSINSGSTRFNQARQSCQKLIPAGLPYSGSGG
jgi:hypothetical protein